MPPRTMLQPRKQPRQKRSRATVEAILEAAARVLISHGYDKATTNRIAQVAGVSVGSLYQYFPSKEALVVALAQQHFEAMVDLLESTSEQLRDVPLEQGVRTYVKAMLAAHALRPEMHQVLVTQVLHLAPDVIAALERRTRDVVEAVLVQRRAEIVPQDLRMAAFVLVAAVEAVTHRAVLEQPEQLCSGALEEELCALVLRYLACADPVASVATSTPTPARQTSG